MVLRRCLVLVVSDIRNATLNRDLSKYKGFVPAHDILAEGLVSPSFGHTFKVLRGPGGGFQGVYVGAAPYISLHANGLVDQGLTNGLARWCLQHHDQPSLHDERLDWFARARRYHAR